MHPQGARVMSDGVGKELNFFSYHQASIWAFLLLKLKHFWVMGTNQHHHLLIRGSDIGI